MFGALDTTGAGSAGSVTVSASTIEFGGLISTDGADVSLTGNVEIQNAPVSIDTQDSATGNAGSVTFSGSAGQHVFADRSGRTLSIDTSTNDANGDAGDVTLLSFGNGGPSRCCIN